MSEMQMVEVIMEGVKGILAVTIANCILNFVRLVYVVKWDSNVRKEINNGK